MLFQLVDGYSLQPGGAEEMNTREVFCWRSSWPLFLLVLAIDRLIVSASERSFMNMDGEGQTHNNMHRSKKVLCFVLLCHTYSSVWMV